MAMVKATNVNNPTALQDTSMPKTYQTVVNGKQMTQVDAGNKSNELYRSNLNTNFGSAFDPGATSYNDYGADSDADVRQAQYLTNVLSEARNTNSSAGRGVDQVATQAQLDAVLGRIGQKNALGEAIKGNQKAEAAAEDELKYDANQALASGVKNTRQNYNNRGLLYSGLRQGGEGAVKSGVAANLGSGLANTKRDYRNLADSQKQAYAAVGLAQEQKKLDMANQAFDSVSRNNIARQQAYQQLGQGLGAAGGAIYSSYSSKPSGGLVNSDNQYQYAGTGSSDGYGGSQMSARNDDAYWRTS